jgi:hypothetical protein
MKHLPMETARRTALNVELNIIFSGGCWMNEFEYSDTFVFICHVCAHP